MKKFKWAVADECLGIVSVFCKSKKKAKNFISHHRGMIMQEFNMHKRERELKHCNQIAK